MSVTVAKGTRTCQNLIVEDGVEERLLDYGIKEGRATRFGGRRTRV